MLHAQPTREGRGAGSDLEARSRRRSRRPRQLSARPDRCRRLCAHRRGPGSAAAARASAVRRSFSGWRVAAPAPLDAIQRERLFEPLPQVGVLHRLLSAVRQPFRFQLAIQRVMSSRRCIDPCATHVARPLQDAEPRSPPSCPCGCSSVVDSPPGRGPSRDRASADGAPATGPGVARTAPTVNRSIASRSDLDRMHTVQAVGAGPRAPRWRRGWAGLLHRIAR